MSNKFDAEAYVARWEKVIVPTMLSVIGISLLLVILLNIKTQPDCLRHEFVYCGTPSQSSYPVHHGSGGGHGTGAGDPHHADEGASTGHAPH